MKVYRKYFIMAVFALLLVVVITFSFYYSVWSKENVFRKDLISKAFAEVEALKEIDEIDYFTGVKEFYFIFGRNTINVPMLVWVNQEEVNSVYLYEWVTKEEIKQKSLSLFPGNNIIRINAGITRDNKLIYEVLVKDKEERLGYQYFSLVNGEYLNSYRLGKSR